MLQGKKMSRPSRRSERGHEKKQTRKRAHCQRTTNQLRHQASKLQSAPGRKDEVDRSRTVLTPLYAGRKSRSASRQTHHSLPKPDAACCCPHRFKRSGLGPAEREVDQVTSRVLRVGWDGIILDEGESLFVCTCSSQHGHTSIVELFFSLWRHRHNLGGYASVAPA